MTGLDRIGLTGIRVFGRHGVLAAERENGQHFVVDATMWVDTRAAAVSDDVADTVHYGEVAELIARIVEGEPVSLLERLAARLADAVLEVPLVERVRITVHKPEAPITVPFDDVTVSIVRGKDIPS